LKFWWYDGNPEDKLTPPLRPSPEVTKDLIEMYEKLPHSGCLLVGDKGNCFPQRLRGQFPAHAQG